MAISNSYVSLPEGRLDVEDSLSLFIMSIGLPARSRQNHLILWIPLDI